MIEIEKPQIECIETPGDDSYGKYVIEPLERGYGTTLGNALRRIMLSSLPGTAATSIKIAGVQHEFTTIPGVKEDVTEIVLNIKGLLTKLHCENSKTVYIEAVGPCDVKAGDKLDFKVIEFSKATKRITLSHLRTYDDARREAAAAEKAEKRAAADATKSTVKKINASVEKTTLGDIAGLAALKSAMEAAEAKSSKKAAKAEEKEE